MDMESFGCRENMELAEWLETVLKQYCQRLAERQPCVAKSSKTKIKKVKSKKKASKTVLFQVGSDSDTGNTVSASEDDGIKLGESANPDENNGNTTGNIFLLITGIKFEKVHRDFGDHSQDDILRVDIDYFVGDTSLCRNEHFLINVSRRSEKKDEPSMEKMLEIARREIDVYTKIFPKMEALYDCNFLNLKLGVPTCFFGEYETEDLSTAERSTGAKKELVDAFGFDPTASTTKSEDDLNRIETRSIFIIHDLEKMNFFRKKTEQRLTVAETKAVLREIAQIHATSWVIQIKSLKPSLFDTFPFLLHPRQAVPVCVTLCEQGMGPFTNSLAARLKREADGPDLVNRLKSYSTKLVDTFFKLMQPPAYPTPTCLIHLDLQLGNIQFRYNQLPTTDNSGSQSKIPTIPTHESEIECRISNWKIASIGSPLHDVAFLLLSSVAPETRREHTADFIKYYYHVFEDTATKLKIPLPFKLSDLMREYDRSTLFALLLVIGNIEEDQETVLDKASLDSFIEAFRDLIKADTF